MKNPESVDTAILTLAQFMQQRDVKIYGGNIPRPWDSLDEWGQEEYLRDARAYVAAMLAIGWFPRSDPKPLEMLQSGHFTLDLAGGIKDPIITTQGRLSK